MRPLPPEECTAVRARLRRISAATPGWVPEQQQLTLPSAEEPPVAIDVSPSDQSGPDRSEAPPPPDPLDEARPPDVTASRPGHCVDDPRPDPAPSGGEPPEVGDGLGPGRLGGEFPSASPDAPAF
jgi:hypothetical protein